MARAIFQTIYDNVKQSIDDGTYAYQSYLPSETELTQLFDCSRMTVRRAISMLAADGYVLPQQGKGMRVIRNISDEKSRGGGGLETFKEIATSRGFELKTVTTVFELLVCSKALSRITGFPEGCELTRAKRIRYADGHAVCSDDSYYLSSQVPGLTPEIVNDSIYRYLEEDLGIKIATGKRDVTIEHPTPEDARVLDLFAGTGQLGIEALSRGAKSALFVDKRADAVKLVRENLALCHLEENAQVICGDSLAALGTQSGRFDIIFLDPPYESGLLEQAMEKIAQFDILSPHGIMVAESPQNQTLPELLAPYGLYREYRYGKIKVSIYHRAVEEEA